MRIMAFISPAITRESRISSGVSAPTPRRFATLRIYASVFFSNEGACVLMMRRIVSLPFLHTPVADRRALLTPVPLSGTAQTGRPNPVHRVNARTGRIRYCRDCDYGYRGVHFPTPRHSDSGFAATAALVDESV